MREHDVAPPVSSSTPKQMMIVRNCWQEERVCPRRCFGMNSSAAASQLRIPKEAESYLASSGRPGKRGLLKMHDVVLLLRANLRRVALLLLMTRSSWHEQSRESEMISNKTTVRKGSSRSPLEAFQMSDSLLLGEMLLLRLLSTSAVSFAG
jgi:hypothetical protein